MVNILGFPSSNQGDMSLSLNNWLRKNIFFSIHYLKSILQLLLSHYLNDKDLSRPGLSENKVFGSKDRKLKGDINSTKLEYPDLQDISTSHHLVWEYWGWLPGVVYQYFKRLRPQVE